jgi:hypothetical protein
MFLSIFQMFFPFSVDFRSFLTCSNMLKPKPAFPGGLASPYPSRQVHDSEFHASELQDLKIRPGVCDRKMSFIQQIQGKNTNIKPTIMGMCW